MFDLESEIRVWRENLERQKVGDGEILDELESHLREEFDRLRAIDLSDEERFQISAARIGNVNELKKEYRRLRWQRFWNFQNTPLTVKILAAWLIFRGADHLVGMFLILFRGHLRLSGMILLGFLILQIPLGLGLIRGQNKWRIYGLAWSAFRIGAFLYGKLFYTPYRPPIGPDGQPVSVHGLLFGLTIPVIVADIFVYINIAMLLWGCYILAKPSVRNFFRRVNAS